MLDIGALEPMRAIRLAIAVLIAASLAAVPVTASLAGPHAAKAEMSMSASDGSCPCCDATHKCATDICTLKCYSAAAISVEEQPLTEPVPNSTVGMGVAAM